MRTKISTQRRITTTKTNIINCNNDKNKKIKVTTEIKSMKMRTSEIIVTTTTSVSQKSIRSNNNSRNNNKIKERQNQQK